MENSLERKDRKISQAKGLLAFSLTALTVVFIGWLLSFIPNVLDVDFIKENYFADINAFVPEKSEKIQYMALTVLFPILFLLFCKLFERLKIGVQMAGKIFLCLSGGLFAGVLVLFFYIERYNPRMYENVNILLLKPITFLIFLFLSFLWLLYGYGSSNKWMAKIQKFSDYIFLFAPLLLIVLIGYMYVNPTYSQSHYLAWHADAYYYPIHKVNSGLTPGIDFNSLYGFYPYFFSSIMKLVGLGSHNILVFSYVVASLVIVFLFCLYWVIFHFIKNRFAAFLSFVGILFTLILFNYVQYGAPYLQYVPHRILFPSLFLLYAWLYLTKKNHKNAWLFHTLGMALSGLSILWNLDTGIVVFGGYVLLMGYTVLFAHTFKEKKFYIEIGKIILYAMGAVALAVAFIQLITYARSGKLIHLQDFLASQSLFYGSGFAMIRMPQVHPWIVIVLIYAVSLGISLKNLFFIKLRNSSASLPENGMLFILSVVGMGIFSYYQGRSHDHVFLSVVWPAVILLGYYVSKLFQKAASKDAGLQGGAGYKTKILWRGIALALLCLVSLTSIYAMKNPAIRHQLDKKALASENELADGIKTIKEMTNDGAIELDFFTWMDSLYYEAFGFQDTKPFPAVIDLFTRADYNKVLDYMEQTDKPFVMLNTFYDTMLRFDESRFLKVLDRFTVVPDQDFVFCFLETDSLTKRTGIVYEGFFTQESGGTNYWRWSEQKSSIRIFNIDSFEKNVTLKFTPITQSTGDFTFYVTFNGETAAYPLTNAGVEVSLDLNLKPGLNTIEFYTDAPQMVSPGDPRTIYFGLFNLELIGA